MIFTFTSFFFLLLRFPFCYCMNDFLKSLSIIRLYAKYEFMLFKTCNCCTYRKQKVKEVIQFFLVKLKRLLCKIVIEFNGMKIIWILISISISIDHENSLFCDNVKAVNCFFTSWNIWIDTFVTKDYDSQGIQTPLI